MPDLVNPLGPACGRAKQRSHRGGHSRTHLGSERGTERGSSAKTVAPQAAVGYPIRARTAKKEILIRRMAQCVD